MVLYYQVRMTPDTMAEVFFSLSVISSCAVRGTQELAMIFALNIFFYLVIN